VNPGCTISLSHRARPASPKPTRKMGPKLTQRYTSGCSRQVLHCLRTRFRLQIKSDNVAQGRSFCSDWCFRTAGEGRNRLHDAREPGHHEVPANFVSRCCEECDQSRVPLWCTPRAASLIPQLGADIEQRLLSVQRPTFPPRARFSAGRAPRRSIARATIEGAHHQVFQPGKRKTIIASASCYARNWISSLCRNIPKRQKR